jgi:hypothetical protein
MAHNQEGFRFPARAASAIAQYVPVRFVGDPHVTGGSALSETVIRAGSTNELAIGFTTATVATYGEAVSVQYTGFVKAVAGASLGAGAPVGVGSTNGILIPLQATGGPASANLVAVKFAVGIAAKNAVAGDIFTVLIKPDQLV